MATNRLYFNSLCMYLFSSTDTSMYSHSLWWSGMNGAQYMLAWMGAQYMFIKMSWMKRIQLCWPPRAYVDFWIQERYLAAKTKKGGTGSGIVLIIKKVIVYFVKETTFNLNTQTWHFSHSYNISKPLLFPFISTEYLFPSLQNSFQVPVPSLLKLQEDSSF